MNHKNTSKQQQWLENIWYNKGAGKILLLPVTALYCAVNSFKRWKNTDNKTKLPCPVIVVGNIAIGGTGKTPLAIHIVKLLQKSGYKPAIITRGYGGKATRWPQSVTAESDPRLVGDEAVLMAINTHVPVYAGADRMLSIEKLSQTHDCDIIVSDDGMQHYKMPRDIQIAVIDGARMLGNGWCLPAGPLRERKQRLDYCDFLVINGEPNFEEEPKDQTIKQHFGMKLNGKTLVNLATEQQKPLADFKNETVQVITGIGNPQRFFNALEHSGLSIKTSSFPDHHNFSASDLQFDDMDDNTAIVMTEKDAVKCKQFATENYWYLPVKAQMEVDFDESLLKLLS